LWWNSHCTKLSIFRYLYFMGL